VAWPTSTSFFLGRDSAGRSGSATAYEGADHRGAQARAVEHFFSFSLTATCERRRSLHRGGLRSASWPRPSRSFPCLCSSGMPPAAASRAPTTLIRGPTLGLLSFRSALGYNRLAELQPASSTTPKKGAPFLLPLGPASSAPASFAKRVVIRLWCADARQQSSPAQGRVGWSAQALCPALRPSAFPCCVAAAAHRPQLPAALFVLGDEPLRDARRPPPRAHTELLSGAERRCLPSSCGTLVRKSSRDGAASLSMPRSLRLADRPLPTWTAGGQAAQGRTAPGPSLAVSSSLLALAPGANAFAGATGSRDGGVSPSVSAWPLTPTRPVHITKGRPWPPSAKPRSADS